MKHAYAYEERHVDHVMRTYYPEKEKESPIFCSTMLVCMKTHENALFPLFIFVCLFVEAFMFVEPQLVSWQQHKQKNKIAKFHRISFFLGSLCTFAGWRYLKRRKNVNMNYRKSKQRFLISCANWKKTETECVRCTMWTACEWSHVQIVHTCIVHCTLHTMTRVWYVLKKMILIGHFFFQLDKWIRLSAG